MTIKEIEIQLALGSLPTNNKLDLACSRRTSKKVLTILSIDKDWYIRYYVAANPNTPVDILKKLSKDKHRSVRYGVGRLPLKWK